MQIPDRSRAETLARRAFLLLFVVSGFSGLIYQSIWTHYLKLFLGHAAFSQTLVLVIFMGGLALGSWIASALSPRIGRPLLAYAATEALVGVGALLFHRVFVTVTGWSEAQVFAALGAGFALEAWKWGVAALLILPQSVLLGATFPFMSAGLARRRAADPGRMIAGLYFANSLGAAAGVLSSGFVLIAWVGLPGTILTAGLLNIALALCVYLIARRDGAPAPPLHAVAAASGTRVPRLVRRLLIVSMLTGAASFIYEIAWLRMLALVLGASTHAFELMLSAFITGLAIGGLWIRRHVDRLADPERTLGLVQVAMGLFAVLTLAAYGLCFDVMQFVLRGLRQSGEGYLLFNLASHTLALSVMLPATICAGMTLPVITQLLLTRCDGEAAIGRVYAVNTAGAILGVAVAVLWLLPAVGLAWLITIGGAIDIALGLWLLAARTGGARHEGALVAAAAALVLVGVHATLDWDLERMASGVFLRGELAAQDERVLFHHDGRTATVDVVRSATSLSIRTNGKPDAGLMIDAVAATDDESTMTLLAALPLMSRPEARRAAVVGLGSGMTTHTLLGYPGLERVDTIEIEPGMLQGARLLGPKVARAFEDPRSHIHIADARSFLAGAQTPWDLIVSEPSNPWVSGVAGLFSVEFYRIAARRLAPEGLFAQWVHVYQLDEPLVASIAGALGEVFPHYALHATSNGDLLIIAGLDAVPAPRHSTLAAGPLGGELARIGIHGQVDVDWTYIGNDAALRPLFRSYGMPANSDFFPVLDQGAVRARFLDRDAYAMQLLGAGAFRGLLPGHAWPQSGVSADHPLAVARQAARIEALRAHWDARVRGEPAAAPAPDAELRVPLEILWMLQRDAAACEPARVATLALPALTALAADAGAYASPELLAPLWSAVLAGPCAAQLSATQRAWLELLVAAGDGDRMQVEALARALLPPQGEIEVSASSRLLVRLMVQALLARGAGEEGLALWGRYAEDTDGGLPLRALAALARDARPAPAATR